MRLSILLHLAALVSQDLSIAGKRAGLAGERSGLFFEAIRIIKEMREMTNGKYPRYAVYENVYGAFSSNKGEDFRTVLEQLAKIKDADISIPKPDKGKWLKAGEILGDNFSIAWRTLDAEFWGVPQRRRRIYLVTDFDGQSAGEIQFESDRLYGDSQESERSRQGVTGTVKNYTGTSSRPTVCLNDQGGTQMDISDNIVGTLRAETHGHQPIVISIEGNGSRPSHQVYENHSQDSRYKELNGTMETVTAKYGTGGNNQPIVVELKPYSIGDGQIHSLYLDEKARTLKCGAQGFQGIIQPKPYSIGNGQVHDLYLDEKARTLTCMHDAQAVIAPNDKFPYIARRLMPIECCRLQGFPDWWCDDLETENPTDEETNWWVDVFETHRKAVKPDTKPRSRNQIIKWLKNPYSDSAEYKMWGNSLAIPCAYHVLAGISEQYLKKQDETKNKYKVTTDLQVTIWELL